MIRRTTFALALAACSAGLLGPTAGAQPPVQQKGLVNVYLDDVTVQIPLAIAANVCDVTVGVLAGQLDLGSTTCTSDADSTAVMTPSSDDGPVQQSGLVNVAATDITVQVPVAVAANLCDLDVAVLARQLGTAPTCDAVAGASAR